jgi:hypothetical protein
MMQGKVGLWGVLVIIIIVLSFLYFFGFINKERIPDLPKRVCVKWDENEDKCLDWSEGAGENRTPLIRWEWK